MCPDEIALAPEQARGMTTTELHNPPRASRPTEPWGDAPRNARPAASEDPTFAEVLDETVPVIGVVPVAGPPAVFLLGPWVLFGLMLAGPFAVLATLVVLLVAAWALVGLIGAILAAPFVLVRHLHAHWAGRASMRAAAPQLVPVEAR
jgi:hypothetical protein